MDLIWRVNRDREASSGRLWGNGTDIRLHKLWNDADGTVPCYICFLGEIKIVKSVGDVNQASVLDQH